MVRITLGKKVIPEKELNMSPDTLCAIARSNDPFKRIYAARHPNTPTEVLDSLACDMVTWVRDVALSRKFNRYDGEGVSYLFKMTTEDLVGFLSALPEREKCVLELRSGLVLDANGTVSLIREPLKYDDIGAVLGFSGRRARQLEYQAMNRIPHIEDLIDAAR